MAESTLWAAQIEDTEDSRALGSRMIVGTRLVRSWAAASDSDDPLPPLVAGGDGERRGTCGPDFWGGLSYGLARLGSLESEGVGRESITHVSRATFRVLQTSFPSSSML